MANDTKGKVGLVIRSRRNKPKNASSNDASKLKELNSAFESSKNKKNNTNNEKPANKEKSSKKEKPSKKDKKEKKPRKLNAYMVFAMEVRESVKKNHPTASIIEIAKKIGEKWRAMSDSEKAKYKK
jgi:Mg-chelatase subunit ChlI